MKLIWSHSSLIDLDGIYEYISKGSKYYATRTIEKIIERGKQISTFPNSGKKVPEYDNPKIRQVIEGNYRMIYKIENDIVQVLTIVHGSRKIEIEE